MTATPGRKTAEPDQQVFDRELEDLPAALRWREWMGRIEAVLFAGATPVSREDLRRVVGQGASLDLLIEDIRAELEARPYDLVKAGRRVDASDTRGLCRGD